MSLRVFLPLFLLSLILGYGLGHTVLERAFAGARDRRDAEVASPLAAADDPAALAALARDHRGTALGARAELALVRAASGEAREDARAAFLAHYPDSWLRRAWAPEEAR